MAKVLKLKFKGSLGKSHILQIANPKENLGKEAVEEAANKLADAHLFFKNDEEIFVTPMGASYVTTTSEPIYAVDSEK